MVSYVVIRMCSSVSESMGTWLYGWSILWGLCNENHSERLWALYEDWNGWMMRFDYHWCGTIYIILLTLFQVIYFYLKPWLSIKSILGLDHVRCTSSELVFLSQATLKRLQWCPPVDTLRCVCTEKRREQFCTNLIVRWTYLLMIFSSFLFTWECTGALLLLTSGA